MQGLDSDHAELLILGEYAIYQLAAASVVVRIARSADRPHRVKKELCVARPLAAFHGLGDCPCELSGFGRSGQRAPASPRRAASPPGTVTSYGPAVAISTSNSRS
jgi:hypothetical protein